MKTYSCLVALMCLCLVGIGQAMAVDRTGFDEVTRIMDKATANEAYVFSPKTWQKAYEAYEKAQEAVDKAKKQRDIDKRVSEAREYAENALKATDVCRLSLEQYLPPRNKAIEANAPELVMDLYIKAEDQFKKATRKVESGDVKGALKEAEKSTKLFDVAELEAIRVALLGTADRMIERAVADEAEKYAPSTLDKARTARERANIILTRDRYNRTESIQEAQLAEYEARHSSNIAMSVRSLNRNDQAWEKLMLGYEIEMNRVGEQMGLDYLPFDDGSTAAADMLINQHQMLAGDNTEASKHLKYTLARFNAEGEAVDVSEMAETVDSLVDQLIKEKGTLSSQFQAEKTRLEQLSEEHQEMSGQLNVRLEREKKFKKAKRLLNPSEGEVLYNAANDIVLRMGGLSFDSGRSNLKDEHIVLLNKMEQIIQLFPQSKIVVEGHTDALGDANSNQRLSEKRAFAVMQYIRQKLFIPADRIQAIGYGSERPIGSNKTADGRAKNRRIDIVIMH